MRLKSIPFFVGSIKVSPTFSWLKLLNLQSLLLNTSFLSRSLDLLWAAAGNHQTLHQGHRGLNTQSSVGSPVVTMTNLLSHGHPCLDDEGYYPHMDFPVIIVDLALGMEHRIIDSWPLKIRYHEMY